MLYTQKLFTLIDIIYNNNFPSVLINYYVFKLLKKKNF